MHSVRKIFCVSHLEAYAERSWSVTGSGNGYRILFYVGICRSRTTYRDGEVCGDVAKQVTSFVNDVAGSASLKCVNCKGTKNQSPAHSEERAGTDM